MVNFGEMANSPEPIEVAPEPKPKGKGKGKAKAVAQAVVANLKCAFAGTYGRIPSGCTVEFMDNVKYRIFDSGNIGLVNVRFKIRMPNGHVMVAGPASPTFLIDRDDAWRKQSGKQNNRSALHISELDGWAEDLTEAEQWAILTSAFGDRKVKES